MFRASRMEERGEEIDGRKVTVDDWRAAFEKHRDEIVSNHCPR
jgi:hypothetical protein